MLHGSGIKVHGMKCKLHDGSRTECTDDGANAHRTSQQPSDKSTERQRGDTDHRDRDFLQVSGTSHQQRISRSATQGSSHIEKLGISHDRQSDEHHEDPAPNRLRDGNNINIVKEIHCLPHGQRIDKHGQADGLLHQDIDEQDDQRDRYIRIAIEDAKGLGYADTEHVPGACADAGMDGQIYTETIHKQAYKCNERIDENRSGGLIGFLYICHISCLTQMCLPEMV